MPKSVGPEGLFSKVTSVQRVSTVGSAAPKTGCSSASVGKVARMPYTADYYFLAARARSASSYAARYVVPRGRRVPTEARCGRMCRLSLVRAMTRAILGIGRFSR
ncbi:MAG: DUF3455 domain-containing protein [Betaproteobacteria bacterium]|nr:MAG: DUF3455 domain-containing protein [Betaproteobacteria bacterium]